MKANDLPKHTWFQAVLANMLLYNFQVITVLNTMACTLTPVKNPSFNFLQLAKPHQMSSLNSAIT